MRIAVVGLGGVGGYIAAHLAKTSHEVVGFARGEHLAKIKQDGIKIVEDDGEWTSPLDARNIDEAYGVYDVVLFCVKSYDLVASYESIKGYINSNTIILSLSNGVNHGNELRGMSDSKVLDGCVYILSHKDEPGVVHKKGKVFALVFGGLKDESIVLKSILDETDLRVKISDDIQTDIWKKYIFISAFATLTSYYDKSIGYIYEHYFEEALEVLVEIASVANVKGIDIFSEVKKSLNIAKTLPYDASTSMHLDFQNKSKDELYTLTGYIVNEAKKYDLEVVKIKKMYDELLKKHVS